MASKRKHASDDNAAVSPPAKSTKKEVTRSGRVRKKPSKFADDSVHDDIDVSKPPASPDVSSSNLSPPAAVVKVALSPKAVTTPSKQPVPAEPVVIVPEPAPDVVVTDDSAKTSGRAGRMRKKSAKVLEMEEFEEAEKKVTKKPTSSSDPNRKSTGPTPDSSRPSTAHTSPIAAAIPLKKSPKNIEFHSPPGNTPITSKLLLTASTSAVKVKDVIKSPVHEPVLLLSPHTSPKALGRAEVSVSPGKGSVIKLLLNSPAQATSPVVSTSTFSQGSASSDKVAVSTKKKAKSKVKMSPEAVAEVINIDPDVSSPPSKPHLAKLKISPEALIQSKDLPKTVSLTVDTGLVKSIRPLANETQEGLKMKIMLNSPPQAATKQKLLTQALTSPVKEQIVTAKSAAKEAKSKKGKKATNQPDKDSTFLVPGLTAPSSVVHVPIDISNSGIKAASEQSVLLPGGRKAGKSTGKVMAEMDVPMLEDEYGLDLPEITLGEPGEDSLMQIDDENSLMYMTEKVVETSKEKSPPKKKAKVKAGSKKEAIRLGDIPNTGVDGQLVMDLDKIKPDEKKKKKIKEPPEPDKNKKKRAPTAYMLWCTSHRTRVVQDNPGIDFSTVSKTLGEMWSGLPEKEKMMWKRKAKKAAGKGSTIITTGKAQQAAKQAAAAHAPPKHAVTARSTPALTAAILANTAKASVEEAVVSPTKGFGIEPIDAAAHLKILGESLGIIGMKLQEHRGMIAVQGSLSVLLDTMLCALGPLMCLTAEVPETDGCPHDTHLKTLDNIAYFMPGL